MFGAPDIPTGITSRSIPDHVFGPFKNRETALWYANAEFGPGNYSLVG